MPLYMYGTTGMASASCMHIWPPTSGCIVSKLWPHIRQQSNQTEPLPVSAKSPDCTCMWRWTVPWAVRQSRHDFLTYHNYIGIGALSHLHGSTIVAACVHGMLVMVPLVMIH